ncbi:DUF305 domain-containing protein [Azohydromonas caseinilytica]|nr:DUF305 domain-containing protein [Azohydromonas caseinilytica]
MAQRSNLRRHLGALALCSLCALGLGMAHAQQGTGSGGMGPGGGPGGMHGGAGDMHGAMARGMEEMRQMQPTGDADRDFATMMKMHHQQAVDMSQAYLKEAKSPEMRKMAEKIIRDQKREIAQFDKWLQANK